MLSVKIAVSVTLGLLCWNIFGEVMAQRDVDERKGHMRQAFNNRPQLSIPPPKFEQYESVILQWNSQEYRTKIVRRWFDVDDGDGSWWYKVSEDERFYPEGVLEGKNNDRATIDPN